MPGWPVRTDLDSPVTRAIDAGLRRHVHAGHGPMQRKELTTGLSTVNRFREFWPPASV